MRTRALFTALSLALIALAQANGQQAVLDNFTTMRTNTFAPGGILWPINTLNHPMTTAASNGLLTATSGSVPITSIVVSSNVATVTTASANQYFPFSAGFTTVIMGATVAPNLNALYQISSASNSTTFVIPTVGVANGTYTESTLLSAGSFFFFFLPINASPYEYTSPCTSPSTCTYDQAFIQSGTWSPTFNRLSFDYKCDAPFPRTVGGSDGVFQFGTYIRQQNDPSTSDQGTHYYHYSDVQIYANTWIHFVMNRVPSHCNICGSSDRFQDDPEVWFPQNVPSLTPPPTGGTHYWDGLTQSYMDGHFGGIANTACQFTPYTFSTVNNEPDSHIGNFASTYNGSAYEVNFDGPALVPGGETYTVAYSTTGSMHANGFSSGTSGGTVTGYPNNPFLNVLWTSANMPQAANMWVAFRPAMPISGSTGNGVSPIVVVSQVNPNLTTGDQVVVASVGGNTAANGTFTVTEISGQDFKFSDSSLTSIVVASNVATATTANPHGLLVGELIAPKSLLICSGNMQNSGNGVGAPIPITAVPSTTTFKFNTVSCADGTYNNATDPQAYIFSFFSTSLNGSTGNGAYTSGGTMTPTSNTTNFAEIFIPGIPGGTSGTFSGLFR